MACALTTSMLLDCRDSVGGLKEIKIHAHPGLTEVAADYTVSSGVVTIASGNRTGWYTWSLEKETASFDENITTNIQNGTTFYEQILNVVFNKFSAKNRNEIAIYAQTPVQLAVRDMNDNYWLIGLDYGADLTAGKHSSGTARGDRSGSTLTFTAKESQSIVNMSAATYNTLIDT
ncbi:MAG: hypothetical protein A2Z57_11135 [Planctomycetes bacterium RIFCSPHIGHO2_12_39_6]|nr:MAG: hypothetical protein A2Z57_11135 [Planctomycetes bacterium RIFCSPHIGHO2_12_39_6]